MLAYTLRDGGYVNYGYRSEHYIHPIEETKMFKNRFLIVLGVVSLLLVTMAVSRPFSNSSVTGAESANDFYQRHPDWNRKPEASDYYERHPELHGSAASVADIADDFALRHPEWIISVQSLAIPATGMGEASDYFQRHPELRTPNITIDLSDYFQRH